MKLLRPERGVQLTILLAAGALLMAGVAGCNMDGNNPNNPNSRNNSNNSPLNSRYPTVDLREVPEFLKGTILEMADLTNTDPYPVSGFGLVVNLAGTGDNQGTPMAVRNHIYDELVRRRFGARESAWSHLRPERVLNDPNTAIVEVYAWLPAGARKGQRIDVVVEAVRGSQTASLAHGTLYDADLYDGGVDPLNPRGRVNIYARAGGPIFINPAHLMGSTPREGALRSGTLLNGGVVANDRAIWLRLRTPQLSLSRGLEARIVHRFQDQSVARAQDEGLIYLVVPHSYNGNWEHFAGVVMHMYVQDAPGMGARRARMLAQEALKPNAPLQNISYAFEAIGPEALPFVRPLYSNASHDVAYAAARAGAFLRDAAAEDALLHMARSDRHAFQVNAARTLAALQYTPRLERMLSEMLATTNPAVRIEAYEALSANNSRLISRREVSRQFLLEQVTVDGPPLVYATRTGTPRIALFGREMNLKTPIFFSGLNGELTISTSSDGRSITLFDRASQREGIQARMRPDVYEMLYRLGGGSDDGFRFSYAHLVGILQALNDGQHLNGTFVLQALPSVEDTIEDAPRIVPRDLGAAAGVQ